MTEWVVYLLECSDGTLYCGITNNLEKRLRTHNRGKGAKYTRGRLPVRLRCYRRVGGKGEALRLECRVKKVRRCRKEGVLTGGLPELG